MHCLQISDPVAYNRGRCLWAAAGNNGWGFAMLNTHSFSIEGGAVSIAYCSVLVRSARNLTFYSKILVEVTGSANECKTNVRRSH